MAFGLGSGARAAEPLTPFSRYGADLWTIEDGLPGGVTSAVQTPDGYVWLASFLGLVRFDGVRFTTFGRGAKGVASDQVQELALDADGTLWIGTWDGLTKLSHGAFTSYSLRDGLPAKEVRHLSVGKGGSLWIGTSAGLAVHRDGRFSKVPGDLEGAFISAVAGDDAGGVWVGAKPAGLFHVTAAGPERHPVNDGLLADRVLETLVRSRDGSLWVGTSSGLVRLEGEAATLFTEKDGLPGGAVLSLVEDARGTLWIGTEKGLARYRDGRISTETDPLARRLVRPLLADREGSLWFASRSSESVLVRLREQKIWTLGAADDVPVHCVLEAPSGDVWVGTDEGLDRVGPGGKAHFSTANGLAGDIVYCLAAEERTLWIGTDRGLCRFADGKLDCPLPGPSMFALHRDASGAFWVGGFHRLLRLSANTRTAYGTSDGLKSSWVRAIAEDARGALWFATHEGLARFDGTGFHTFGTEDGLAGSSIFALLVGREGSLWIATEHGLSRYKAGGFRSVAAASPVLSDVFHSILEDRAGNLWLASDRGLFRAAEKDLEAFLMGRAAVVQTASYGTLDGMRSSETNDGTCAVASDGRLLFPTAKGVAVVDPTKITTAAPRVVLEELVVDGQQLPLLGAVSLPPGRTKLELHYTALGLKIPQKARFRYQLEGVDREWVEAGTRRIAYYTTVPSGVYTFRVRASNEDGYWDEGGARLRLTIEPYFHQTLLFRVLCAAALAVLLGAVYRMRVQRLAARQRELESKVDERTRELNEAQEKIAGLLESSAEAVANVSAWAHAVAGDVASTIGAKEIGAYELEAETVREVSVAPGSALAAPSSDDLKQLLSRGGAFLRRGETTVVPVTGLTGDLCGALLVAGGGGTWADAEARLLAGFAHQLGGAIEINRMRRRLREVEEHRAATLRAMHEKGIATLQVCPVCGRCYDHTAERCADDGWILEAPRRGSSSAAIPFRLLDRYRFTQVLGRGGMGLVLAARDEKLERDVAVKLIRPERFVSGELKERFEREARVIARIQHPGVVSLFDSGELEDGTSFLVMERLEGRDLALVLRLHGRGTPAQVAALVRQGAAALHAAHRAGIVHRDVKPENVFLAVEGDRFRVKLLDFGLAKSIAFERGLTQTGLVLGTPPYMAPEQVQGEDVDARADVYSFAAVAYEALTGTKAVPGDDLGGVLIRVLNTEPAAVSSLVPGIPDAVDAAFASALAKDRNRRLADIGLWSSSFVDQLAKVPDHGEAGWPFRGVPASGVGSSRAETTQIPRGRL